MDQTPQNSYHPGTTGVIDKEAFSKKYWFTSLQMVEVINPAWLKDGDGFIVQDYPFMVEMRHFIIKAGGREKFPGVIANVYLDQMTKILAQNEGKLEFMADPNLMRVYYDKLIVDVENLAPEYNPVPAYLRDVAPSGVGQAKDETPPWQQNMEQARSAMPDNAPQVDPRVTQLETKVNGMSSVMDAIAAKLGVGEETAPAAAIQPPEPVITAPDFVRPPAQPEERQFDFQDATYKMTIDKNGDEMFFKDGRRVSAADYQKAASMI